MPHLLQLAVTALEFSAGIVFRAPPLVVQRVLFGALAAIARWRGNRPMYPGAIQDGARPPANLMGSMSPDCPLRGAATIAGAHLRCRMCPKGCRNQQGFDLKSA
jgi:hypothetical protein